MAWKEKKLVENGYKIPGNLHFVPVDFETSSWWDEILNKGFDVDKKTVVSCAGVTLYLTNDAIIDTLRKMTLLASGSTIAMAFYLPPEQLDEEDKPLMEISMKGAAAAGTPFMSFYSVNEIVKLAEDIGFTKIQTVSTKDMTERYFKDRLDNFVPASGEFFLVAKR